jgi:hypothetical protein
MVDAQELTDASSLIYSIFLREDLVQIGEVELTEEVGLRTIKGVKNTGKQFNNNLRSGLTTNQTSRQKVPYIYRFFL